MSELQLVEILSTMDMARIALIRSLLEAEGIGYSFQGELYSGSGVFLTPARLMVPEDSAAAALDLLREHGLLE